MVHCDTNISRYVDCPWLKEFTSDIFLLTFLYFSFIELSDLPISSPSLSDRAYVGALSISAVYARFASFSTSLSDKSLMHLVKGLKEVAVLDQTSNMIANPVRAGDASRVPTNKANESKDGKGTIGEKLMNIGVRAIYGGNESLPQTDDIPLTERTTHSFYHDYQLCLESMGIVLLRDCYQAFLDILR